MFSVEVSGAICEFEFLSVRFISETSSDVDAAVPILFIKAVQHFMKRMIIAIKQYTVAITSMPFRTRKTLVDQSEEYELLQPFLTYETQGKHY